MKILVAGASGAVGKRLVPLLVTAGHQVVATTRTPQKLENLRALGAEAVMLDGLDRDAVMKTVQAAHPDVIVHEMTALASMRSLKHLDKEFVVTNRLRTEGTDNLLAAARWAGVRKLVVQSYSGWPNQRVGSRIKNEDDPLDTNPPKSASQTLQAINTLETVVKEAHGIVGIGLRYGSFYGPGTALCEGGEMVELVRKRMLPLVGEGSGVWSFIHVDDAAYATRLAIERGAAGIYNIVDDDPAEVSEWLPDLARAIGAKPPYHIPVWLARPLVGDTAVLMMTSARGSSNAKAKRDLGWQPGFASWREGFRRGLAAEPGPRHYLKAG
jgi:nucleoside-diphosphate-sugar epimerase